MIPVEAVEAAATAAERVYENWGGWEDVARAALEAAAPHMLRDLRELVEDMEAQPPSEIGSVRGHGRHYQGDHEGDAVTKKPAKWTQTNPSETIRQLVREWVNENKQHEGDK